MTIEPRSLTYGLATIAALTVCSLLMLAAVPQGWYLAGSKPASYEAGTDGQTEYNGHPSAYLKSKETVSDGFGTLMQDFGAEKYAGKRVRFSAFAKSEGVEDWAGLWMRIDKGSQMMAFDNMQDRAIRGTTGWKAYEVVLDAPQDATGIFFGVLLSKTGAVWLNSVKFEVVGSNVPITGRAQRDGPTNLGFENH
jgi:hypothetical protein